MKWFRRFYPPVDFFWRGHLFWKAVTGRLGCGSFQLGYQVVVVATVRTEPLVTMMLERNRVTIIADVFVSSSRSHCSEQDAVIHCRCSRAFVQWVFRFASCDSFDHLCHVIGTYQATQSFVFIIYLACFCWSEIESCTAQTEDWFHQTISTMQLRVSEWSPLQPVKWVNQ